jgi:hypothetical protein
LAQHISAGIVALKQKKYLLCMQLADWFVRCYSTEMFVKVFGSRPFEYAAMYVLPFAKKLNLSCRPVNPVE